jgi:hypothetical protein
LQLPARGEVNNTLVHVIWVVVNVQICHTDQLKYASNAIHCVTEEQFAESTKFVLAKICKKGASPQVRVKSAAKIV